MTSLTGYIQGLGGGERRTVDKTGKEVKLSVFDNIDNVIVFNQAGETSQTTLTGKNLIYPKYQGRTDKGVDFTVNSDGSITCYGTATANAYSAPNLSSDESKMKKVPAGTYTLSGAIPDNARVYLGGKYIDDSSLPFNTDTGNGRTFTLTQEAWVYPVVLVLSGVNADFTVYIQLEAGSSRTDYEPYCGGVPSPNPDYPQAVEGIGFLYHGAYAVAIDYDDGDEHYGRILATGLAYPLYEGDILDFANGKVIRANGYRVLDGSENWEIYSNYNGYFISTTDMKTGNKLNGYSDKFIAIHNTEHINNSMWFGVNSKVIYFLEVNISGVTDLASWKTWLSNNNTAIVYPLSTPTEEYITIEGGDIADIGTATVEADGTLTVKYDKVEMAIRKYSSPPDWSKIGYTETPSFILDGFNYSKQIYDSWTSAASYASKFRGDKELKYFPDVDLTGATNYSAMFQESGIQFTEPLTIGDDSNTVVNCQWMFQTSPIEDIEITNENEEQGNTLTNIFNGCSLLKKAKLNLLASGSMQNAFADCTRLERIEGDFDTSSVTSIQEAFRACAKLVFIYELNLASCTSCYRAFQDCTSMENAPIMTLTSATNLQQMFWNCSSLKEIPFYNIRSATNITNMFQGTGSNLSDNSRNNIMMMLVSATSYSGTKTLAQAGFTSSMYSASSWQSLSRYSEFVNAGWSIGYS